MANCPYCGAEWEEGQTECRICKHPLVAEPTLIMETNQDDSQTPKTNNKNRKKIAVIVSVVFVLAILIGCLLLSVFLFSKNRAQANTQKEIISIWDEVIATSEILKSSMEEVESYDKLNELLEDVNDQREIVMVNTGKIKVLQDGGQYQEDLDRLMEAVNDYDEYLSELADFLNRTKDVDLNKDLRVLKKKADKASDSSQKLVNTLDYLTRNLKMGVFELSDKIADIISKQRSEEEDREKAEEEKQKEEQDKLDEKTVEEVVTSFMIAFRDRDELKMKILMTKQAKDRFEPADEFKGNYYIRDFEVMSKEQISTVQFQVKIREYDEEIVTESETKPFTTDRLFIMIKTEDKWLVDEWGVIE